MGSLGARSKVAQSWQSWNSRKDEEKGGDARGQDAVVSKRRSAVILEQCVFQWWVTKKHARREARIEQREGREDGIERGEGSGRMCQEERWQVGKGVSSTRKVARTYKGGFKMCVFVA